MGLLGEASKLIHFAKELAVGYLGTFSLVEYLDVLEFNDDCHEDLWVSNIFTGFAIIREGQNDCFVPVRCQCHWRGHQVLS